MPENEETKKNLTSWLEKINRDFKLAISVDCVIFGYTDADLYIALRPCTMPPFEGDLSLVGELLEPHETLDTAAKRILFDRTQLDDVYLEQVQTFSDIDRHPLGRVITVAYYSLIKLDEYYDNLPESGDLQWIKIQEVKTLAFDHNQILDCCLSRLQFQLREQPVGFSLLPKKFTLNQLQQLYEVILGITIDKRNFRRKLKSLDILQDQGEHQTDVSHRPAKLYSFCEASYQDRVAEGLNLKSEKNWFV